MKEKSHDQVIQRKTFIPTAIASFVSLSHAAAATHAVPSIFPLPAPTASTVPSRGDVNPYGVAFVPRSVPTDGMLKHSAILVSNFNNNLNLRAQEPRLFRFRRTEHKLCSSPRTAHRARPAFSASFRTGLVLCGTPPSVDGTSQTARPGDILVIDRFSNLRGTLMNPNLMGGPWGMATGTILRMDVVENGSALSVVSATVIVSGLTHRGDPAAFELGPSGIAYDAEHDALFFADSADNTIYAVRGAAEATASLPIIIVYRDTFTCMALSIWFCCRQVICSSRTAMARMPIRISRANSWSLLRKVSSWPSSPWTRTMVERLASPFVTRGLNRLPSAAVDDNQKILRIWTETLN